MRRIVKHLEGREPHLDLPVDVRATAFQWRVWEELRRIPRGETRSYAEVARAIGSPRAVRAVARACATNPVALVVPCHRVVPAAGGTGGYRWGAERKARLLERESVSARSGRIASAVAAAEVDEAFAVRQRGVVARHGPLEDRRSPTRSKSPS